MKRTPLATWPDIPRRVEIPLRGIHSAERKTHLAISSSGRHAPTGRLRARELSEILPANGGIRANAQRRSVWRCCVSEDRTELKQHKHRATTRLGIPLGRLGGDLPSQGRRYHRGLWVPLRVGLPTRCIMVEFYT